MKTFLTFLFCVCTLPFFAQTSSPCEAEAYRQFDFWVGKWTVYKTGTDTIAGYSHIKNILGSCVIEENWKSNRSAFEGKSFNTYNPQDSTWNQVWVDNTGNTYHFKGKYEDNLMDMYGQSTANGQTSHFNMSFTYNEKEKTIRQVWKLSTDEQKNWRVIFDGTYIRELGN